MDTIDIVRTGLILAASFAGSVAVYFAARLGFEASRRRRNAAVVAERLLDIEHASARADLERRARFHHLGSAARNGGQR